MDYNFLLFFQYNLLTSQVLEEILRERSNYYLSRNKIFDFWILISPKFLSTYQATNKSNVYGVIISSNKDFIEWLKLRLGYFTTIEDPKPSTVTMDGWFGKIKRVGLNSINFSSQNSLLESVIFSENYKRIVEAYYKEI